MLQSHASGDDNTHVIEGHTSNRTAVGFSTGERASNPSESELVDKAVVGDCVANRQRVRHIATETRSVADLVNLLSAGTHTPSRSVARHEAVGAIQNAIDQLPPASCRIRLICKIASFKHLPSLKEQATVPDKLIVFQF